MTPTHAELIAQASEALAELRRGAAKRDRALAAAFVSAIQQPFPEIGITGQGCSCAFGPRCESNRCCEDEAATIGIKDRRTGTIRKLAEWSLLHLSRGPAPRPLFYCNDCYAFLKENWAKPIPGLHPPKGADDDWRLSATDMIRLAAIRVNAARR